MMDDDDGRLFVAELLSSDDRWLPHRKGRI